MEGCYECLHVSLGSYMRLGFLVCVNLYLLVLLISSLYIYDIFSSFQEKSRELQSFVAVSFLVRTHDFKGK